MHPVKPAKKNTPRKPTHKKSRQKSQKTLSFLAPNRSFHTTSPTTSPQLSTSSQTLYTTSLIATTPTTTSRRSLSTVIKQPLSYRHLYHAGNHADVMKHAILITLAAQQARKIPFGRLLIDTHAGPGGTYDLQHEYARKTEEFMGGIGRIYDIARLSALNPHIISETTLRRNDQSFDHGYTQDPLYLRLQTPASDIYNPFPYINGIASPGAKTISPQQNQLRSELTVPILVNPHPLLIAGGDNTVSNLLDEQAKDAYLDRVNALPKKQVISMRRKLQRQLTRIRSQLQSIHTQYQLIETLKKEFAMLNIQEAVEMVKNKKKQEAFEKEMEKYEIELENNEKNGKKLVNLNNLDEETDSELLAELGIFGPDGDDDIDIVDDSGIDDQANAPTLETVTTTSHTQNVPFKSHRPRLNMAPKTSHDNSNTRNNTYSKTHSNAIPRQGGKLPPKNASVPHHPNFPLRFGDDNHDEQPTPSEMEEDLLDVHADRQHTGTVPDVGPSKVKDYINSAGEKITYRRLGKAVIDSDGVVKTLTPEGNIVTKPTFKKEFDLNPLRVVSSGIQADPIESRRRTINVLTKRLVSAYDPIEEVAESIHEFHQEMRIPTKNNNLLNQAAFLVSENRTSSQAKKMSQFLDSQPEDENSKLVITRTNQLHTAQLSAFLRHLLPIPNSMLPYISLMTHASKPPSLSAIVTRPNYASLLVGDAISSEKAKALEDRQDRDTTEGAFTTSIRLSKDEKTHLLKEIINSNVMDAHINSANDVYHKAQNEVIDIYFKRDSEEIDAIPSKKNTHKNSNSAQDVINTNMASHKPHMSLINPTTNQQFIPVTMNQNEWIETFTGDNPANTSLRSISDMNLIHSEDLVYPSSTRVPAHAILYAPNPNKKVNDMKKQQQRRSRAVNLNHNDTSAPRRDFEIDMQYGIDEIPQQNSKGFMGRNDNGGKRFGERNGGNNNRSFDRNNRSNNQNSSPSDFGINPNALGGNVSMKVNNSFDDANEKRAERELRYDLKPNSYDNNGERRIDRGNSSNFNRSGDRPSSNRNDRNSGFRGGFGNRNGDHSRDNTGDRPFGRNRDQKSSYQHGNSYKNNNNGYDGKNEQNEKRQYQPRDRDNFVKKMNANQQKDGNKSPNQNRDPMGSFDTTSSQTPKKTSLRDLKYSNPPSTTGKRTFTTSGRISRSTNRSLLPPTLRKMAPYARLGLINPGMITDILKRHFGTQTGAGNVWKNIMKQEKEAQDGQFKHNNNNPNNYHAREKAKISDNKDKRQFENEKDGKNKSAEKGPKFDKSEKGNKRDKFSNKFSPNPRDQTSFNHVNTNNIPQRSVPRGDSRRSRDKARSKDDRLEVWNRSAPSTKLLGADDLNDVAPVDSFELEPTLSDQKLEPKEAKKLKEARDAAKRDSIQTINQTFVQYPDTVPTLLPKAPVKSLYSTAESPIDVISQMYWTGTSKSRKRKNKKVLGKQNDSKNGNKIPDLNGLHQKDEELEGYRLEIDSAIEVLFDQDAEAGERFEALSKYENFHKLAQDALSYLTKSVEVYTNQTKLFNIPLNQPLYSSPSSPWVMTNLLRHEIYDNTTASVDSLDIESYGKLPGHIPMIKDILVLNELHSTEYQTLRKNNGDTIMGEFYKETVENHVNERIAHLLDIKTSTTTTLEKAQKIEQQENEHNRGKISIKIAQNELDSETAQGDSKHQRAQRVPANSNTLGDAISRLAATVATETTMGFNPAMSIMGQKYQNFNSLMIPVNIDNHGAHNIFIDGNSNQTIALQYNGFGSAQIFLKQFQYYTDFIARMSYSAMNPNTPAVQYINNIHDEQYLSYSDKYKQRETMFQNKRGKNGQQQEQTPFPEKKNKNDNFISTSLILCDPAYETGEEYVHVLDLLRTTLDFNSRGNAHTLAIWYPVLDKIDPLLPDPVLNQAEDDEFDQNGYPKKHQTPFDMQSVARRDVNRGHFLETLSKQFKQTPKHDHHKLFLSLSSFFVQKYRTTLPTPALSGIPYNTQAPTGNLDTVVAETYVGIPPNVTPQRKNIYMSGSGMLVHSPLLPQELDQSLTTMLPWISTALHTDSFNNVYNHVVKTKQLHHSSRLEQRNNDDGQGEGENGDNKVKSAESVVINGGMDLTKVALPPLADFTLHWM